MKSSCRRRTTRTVVELMSQAIYRSALIADELYCGCDTRRSFDDLAILLESLPLTQGEYDWLCCRLTNAAQYAAASQRHTATWEILQLNRRLRTLNGGGGLADGPEPL